MTAPTLPFLEQLECHDSPLGLQGTIVVVEDSPPSLAATVAAEIDPVSDAESLGKSLTSVTATVQIDPASDSDKEDNNNDAATTIVDSDTDVGTDEDTPLTARLRNWSKGPEPKSFGAWLQDWSRGYEPPRPEENQEGEDSDGQDNGAPPGARTTARPLREEAEDHIAFELRLALQHDFMDMTFFTTMRDAELKDIEKNAETCIDDCIVCGWKYKVGICAEPVSRYHAKYERAKDPSYAAEGMTMYLIAGAGADETAAAEISLVRAHMGRPLCLNRAPGGGGRGPSGSGSFLYVCALPLDLS